MKLSPEQKQRLIEHINKKWRPPFQCGCCGQNNWDVSSEIYQIIEFAPEGLKIGGPVVPLAPVTCTNCGNTILVNALVANILNNRENEPQAAGEKKDG